MSKSNRIKGVFSSVYGCRIPPCGRKEELESRTVGLTEQHKPAKFNQGTRKLTKTQRKEFKSLAKYEKHQKALNAGYAKVMGFVTSVITKPEVSLI